MNFLIGLLIFICGWTLGVFTRNILIKVINIRNKIQMAEKIVAKEEKRKEFKEKYDFSDCFDEEKK